MASPGDGSGSHEAGVDSIGDLLDHLTLQDDELDNIMWGDEIDAPEVRPKWLALCHLLTNKSFNQSALIGDMKAAWNPTEPVVWRRIKPNLFLIQLNCLGYWNKAMHKGLPEKVKLDRLETWAHIHRLPDGVLNSKSFLQNLASRIGEVQEVQVTLPNGFVGEFIRARVRLDVSKKLTRVVQFTKAGEREKYRVNFEKLPTFCYACGLMGH